MAQPTIFSDGAVPNPTDSRWRILVKIVGAIYNAATTPNSDNIPKATDTRWKLLRKWNRIKTGS